jgi:biopolymer transport protein TolR
MAWVAPQHGESPMASMNVTPLTDVLLVMIITFMVISPLTPFGLDAQVTRPAPGVGSDAVVITLDAAGKIQINRDRVALADVETRLRGIFKTRNGRSILLKCDPSLSFSRVARVMDLAKSAGMDRVGLITDQVAEAH